MRVDQIKIGTPILDLHVGHVGGEAQKNSLSILFGDSREIGFKSRIVTPEGASHFEGGGHPCSSFMSLNHLYRLVHVTH